MPPCSCDIVTKRGSVCVGLARRSFASSSLLTAIFVQFAKCTVKPPRSRSRRASSSSTSSKPPPEPYDAPSPSTRTRAILTSYFAEPSAVIMGPGPTEDGGVSGFSSYITQILM
ncbi:hypothetical protein Vafri_13306 [Volvox africanus]|nr:hypothetical protein Vafri_13306 [Volvox africanus]